MIDQTSPGTRGNRPVGTLIADLVAQRRADVTGVIRSARPMSIGRAPACRYTLTDGTGELDLLFLGRVQIAGMRCGRRCRVKGTIGIRDGRLVLWNPQYWLAPAGSETRDVLVVDDDAAIRRGATRTAWLAHGASDYLPEPFAMDTLLAEIR